MHQMRKLVLDNDQRCPVPLNEKKGTGYEARFDRGFAGVEVP